MNLERGQVIKPLIRLLTWCGITRYVGIQAAPKKCKAIQTAPILASCHSAPSAEKISRNLFQNGQILVRFFAPIAM
jgi:hypothetical protein